MTMMIPLLAAALLTPQETKLKAQLPTILEKCAAHYRALDAAATPQMKAEKGGFRVPRSWTEKRGLILTGEGDWTSGHYAGTLWYLYEGTGDAFFRDRAVVWTEVMAANAKRTDTHDLGFMMYCSYGNAKRLLKTDRYDAILVQSSDSLCKRYHEKLGLIRSWGAADEKKNFLVIPDNLMNLEMLEEVARMTGEKRYSEISQSHAAVTSRHHFRADSSCYHVLDYDQATGRVKEIRRGQGAGCESAWSRGQSWAIYGYTLRYRYTKAAADLTRAAACADYAINAPTMPADGVPCWDYGAPGEERDASAAAVMASALLELAGYVGGEKGAAYRAFAVKQIRSLSSSAYFAAQGDNGDFLLKHSVGAKPYRSEIDVPLNYADYYYLEALIRFNNLTKGN